jgi:gliding motility-associated-like protein
MKMNKVYSLLALFLFSVFSHSGMNAQSTVGTDFWVTFLPNYDVTVDELSLIAAGNDSCTGVVTNPYTGWSTSFTVVPGIITNIYIPQSEAYDDGASDSIIHEALHITTTDSISLYASNFYVYTFDVTNVLPTPSLGSEYILQTYRDKAEFSVIATEDSTTVNILLTENSLHHQANTPFSVSLNAGQCYQVKSTSGVDLSGSIISASGDKKIAVFAGNHWVHIPNNIDGGDHVVEQMMPTSAWGKEFVITNSMLRTKDKVKVTALNNNCQVWKDGELLTTLNARQTYEFEITNTNPVSYLETSEPASVFLYFTGSRYGGENGDPSMVIINPTDQKINNVTFSTFSTGATGYQHFVNIVTKTANVPNMRLDGNDISSNFTAVPIMQEFSYARITINHGSHAIGNTLITEESGFVAHIYGLAPWESYSYSAGSMVVEILNPPHLIVNGLDADDYPEGFEICSDSSFVFDLDLNYVPSNVVWEFGDGTTGDGYPISHSYDTLGQYDVMCSIYVFDEGAETLDTILFTSLSLKRGYDTTIVAAICSGDVYADNGFNESETGIYVDTLQTIYGCDSIVRLDLTVHPAYNDTILAYICEGEVYNQNGFYLDTDTVITRRGQTIYGCDSVVTLILKVGALYSDTIHASITEGQYYDENGFNECEEGFYSRHLTTVNYGCDSSVYLVLSVNQRSDLYVPNCITPLSPTNSRFEIVHGKSLAIDEVFIYNRAGEILFHSIGNTEVWDGTYHGYYCPQAAYVYVIYYHEVGNLGKKEKVGTVVLLY